MSKIKKILVVVAIFLIIMISALLATHAKGTSSWVGEYSGVEVTYSDTESGSYKKNQVTLCISEVAQGTQVELDIKELVGNDNGLDVTVLNRASNTVLISEKFIGKRLRFLFGLFRSLRKNIL